MCTKRLLCTDGQCTFSAGCAWHRKGGPHFCGGLPTMLATRGEGARQRVPRQRRVERVARHGMADCAGDQGMQQHLHSIQHPAVGRFQHILRTAAFPCSLIVCVLLSTGCLTAASAAFDDTDSQRFAAPNEGLAVSLGDAPAWQDHRDVRPQRSVFQFAKFSDAEIKLDLPNTFWFLPNEEPGSRSLGSSTRGQLVHGAYLAPVGDHWRILTRQRARHLNYGSDALIALIQDAAETVAAAHPESVLLVGNIGAPHGGAIRYSVSHHNGKDADLAFYATDPDGVPVDAPDLLIFNDNGQSRAYQGYYRFDVARNWSLVEALINSRAAEIQYLFISNGLRKLLLDHAREIGAADALIAQAETLLRQPGVKAPHDDHLHIRIFCSMEDLMVGCEDFGAMHAWAPRHRAAHRAGVERALGFLEHASIEGRRAAIARLQLLDARETAPQLADRLNDEAPIIRQEAADATRTLAPDRAPDWIGERLRQESDLETAAFFLQTLAKLPGDRSAMAIAEFLMSAEESPLAAQRYPAEKGEPLVLYAIDALARSESLYALPVLLSHLRDDDLEIRARAAQAIAMVANQRPSDFDWSAPNQQASALEEAASVWDAWIETATAANATRLELALSGLREAGYTTPKRGRDLAASLARAAGDERPHIRVNAQRMLMAMTDTRPGSLDWPPEDARAYWTRWTTQNPRRIVALR